MKGNPKITALYDAAVALHAKGTEILAAFEGTDLPPAKTTEAKGFLDQAEAKIAEAQMLEKAEAMDTFLNKPREGMPKLFSGAERDVPVGPFKGRYPLGEFGIAVAEFYRSGGTKADPRLHELKALGLNEAILSEGGFLVQQDLEPGLLQTAYETGILVAKVRTRPISASANGLKINLVDETSRVDGSLYGGLQAYWGAEGGTKLATKPKFRRAELSLEKLIGLYYATDEELQDAGALEAGMREAFAQVFAYKLDKAIYEGTGGGMPLGIMGSAALVTVAKKTGQVAATVVKENIDEMWARMWAPSRPNALWLINQDVEPQLEQLVYTIGIGGVPAYMPPGGIADAPFGRLKSRPVQIFEHCSTLGTLGDIVLVDPTQYLMIDKGGVQYASSIHVQFVTDEQAFRFVYRVDGMPLWNAPKTPAKGANTLSPFVTLAPRV